MSDDVVRAVKNCLLVKHGGACLLSQHSRGRGRQISEFGDSLVYSVNSRPARATQSNSVSKCLLEDLKMLLGW